MKSNALNAHKRGLEIITARIAELDAKYAESLASTKQFSKTRETAWQAYISKKTPETKFAWEVALMKESAMQRELASQNRMLAILNKRKNFLFALIANEENKVSQPSQI